MVTYMERSHLATVVVGSSTETVGSKYRGKLVNFRYRYQPGTRTAGRQVHGQVKGGSQAREQIDKAHGQLEIWHTKTGRNELVQLTT